MKQNQIIALVQGKKARLQKFMTEVHHGWRRDLLDGMTRSYKPLNDEGERFPPESKIVQVRAKDVLEKVKAEIQDFLAIVASQEITNTTAKGDVVVGEETILGNVPISVLLFLEKQLTDIRTLVAETPTLPPDKTWQWDGNRNCWTTVPEQTTKTKKQVKVIVKYEATKEHPAQTEMISVDETIGHWTIVHLSGGLPEQEQQEMLHRIEELQDAVKVAREQANQTEAFIDKVIGKAVVDYIFTSQ